MARSQATGFRWQWVLVGLLAAALLTIAFTGVAQAKSGGDGKSGSSGVKSGGQSSGGSSGGIRSGGGSSGGVRPGGGSSGSSGGIRSGGQSSGGSSGGIRSGGGQSSGGSSGGIRSGGQSSGGLSGGIRSGGGQSGGSSGGVRPGGGSSGSSGGIRSGGGQSGGSIRPGGGQSGGSSGGIRPGGGQSSGGSSSGIRVGDGQSSGGSSGGIRVGGQGSGGVRVGGDGSGDYLRSGGIQGVREAPRPGGGNNSEQYRRGIPYPREVKVTGTGLQIPDRSGNHNNLRQGPGNAGIAYKKPSFGTLERTHDLPGVIVNTGGWRHGYWHHNRNWRDDFWYWDFYYFDPIPRLCAPSLYYYYGCVPGYLWSHRVIWVYRPVIVLVEVPMAWVYVGNSYYLERPAYTPLDRAITDITDAWRYGNPDLIDRHVLPDSRVAVFLDGEYSYSLEGYDYAAITRDAVLTVRTKSFTVDNVARRGDGLVVLYATHTYISADDYYETVYVTYTLEQRGYDWYIVEAGSSSRPLR